MIPEGLRSWQRLRSGSSEEKSTVTQFLYSLDVTPRAYYLYFDTSCLLLLSLFFVFVQSLFLCTSRVISQDRNEMQPRGP